MSVAGARETYDAMAADYVAHVEASPYTALYEAPGLRALLGPLSTHHPAMDFELSSSGDYFATELVVDRWSLGEREYDVRFWRRPLSETFRAIADGGFRIDELSEPQPLPECRARFPEAWARLTRRPQFLFLRLLPV